MAVTRADQTSGCYICQMRDTIAHDMSIHWLSANRARQSQIIGALCCPVHAWHIREIGKTLRETGMPAGKRTAPMRPDIDRLQRALNSTLHDFTILEARIERTGMAGHTPHIPHLRHELSPASLTTLPSCPLCSAEPTEQAESSENQRALNAFLDTYTRMSPAERQNLVWSLCPQDHRMSEAYLADTSQAAGEHALAGFPPAPAPRPRTEDEDWWLVPGYSEGGQPFVRSLLDAVTAPPGVVCPLCWVRANQEEALVVALRQGSALAANQTIAVHGERWRFEAPVTWDIESLCPRHMTLLRMTPLDASPDQTGTEEARRGGYLALSQRPVGTLRRTPQKHLCPCCHALNGWELLRIEGLQRAAGGTPLLEDITARLHIALQQRKAPFCLPHWRVIASAASPHVLEALLNGQVHGLRMLSSALAEPAPYVAGMGRQRAAQADSWGIAPDDGAYLFLAGFPQ